MIAGVETVHRRSVWQRPNRPISGPRQEPRDIRTAVAHHPGCSHCIPLDTLGIPDWLRRNDDSWHQRQPTGYSLGYLWAVDWLGGAWEIRGFDYRSAANLGRKVDGNANYWTAPIQFIVRAGEPATHYAWATARAIWAEHARRAGRRDLGRPIDHSVLDPTDCAGAGIRHQLATGTGDPIHHLEEEDVITQLLRLSDGSIALRGAGPARRVNTDELPLLRSALGPERPVATGSTEEWWVTRELAAYDQLVGR